MRRVLRHIVTSAACASVALSASGFADAKLVRVGEAGVSFHATGPAGLSIVGKTNELAVTDDGDAVIVTVPLSNLTTGIALRDRHMREKYLQVQQYPNAELRVSRSILRIPIGDAESNSEAVGSMKLHGRTKSVTFHYAAKRSGSIHVTGLVHINMNDFGVDVPSYLGISVKPDVDVNVRFDANDA